jgi:uncharacterized protein (TIGR02594 family)
MNGLEALSVLVAVLIVFELRDGLLLWWLIRRIIADESPPVAPAAGAAAAGAAHGPAPAAVPVPGGVAPPGAAAIPGPATPASAKPRFTGITATSFAGGNDSTVSRTSAYDGRIIDGDRELGAALPFHFPGTPPTLRVFFDGKSVDVPVRDVGPWNTNDPYWQHGARPEAETGVDATKRRTNNAGIDLTLATWTALGYSGDPRNAKAKVDWDFADVLDGKAPPSAPSGAPAPAPAISTDPAWLVLTRKLRDLGVHATNDSAIIMSWPAAIAGKFPDMAEYVKAYQHDSTPWCGLTVAYVLAMSGIRPQFGATDTDRFLWANSWAQFGTAVDTPQPGDVLVFKWAGGGHHVTLYDHMEDDAYYHCTGGNQGSGHVVSTEAMPMANCIAIRRPAAAG